MIIVTGATGQLGRAIVEKLVARTPASNVGVSVRDVAKAGELAALGVRVRQGDFAEPATLKHAFEGASQVLLVSSNARAYGGDPIAQHKAALDAARAAGAARVVYTSHMAASEASAFTPMLDHVGTETMLRASGLKWTSLRNGFYAQSGVALLGSAFETGVVEAPTDGPVAWTAHDDLAEAAAYVLTHEGEYEGPTPPLTGSEALDLTDLARIASEVWNKPVRRELLADDLLRARMVSRGLPAHVGAIAVSLYVASRAGEFARVDPTLAQILGRAPITMREVIAKGSQKTVR